MFVHAGLRACQVELGDAAWRDGSIILLRNIKRGGSLKSVRQWLLYCESALRQSGVYFGHGTDNARDEAAWLVLNSIGQHTYDGQVNWDQLLDEPTSQRITGRLQQRIERKLPMAYILGEAWFCGLRFEVSPQVLVPRSPIAELVERAFAPWVDIDRATRALDLCTGCGCIGIAMAVHMPWLQVDAADISEAALAVAQRNVALHGVGERVELFQSDVFDGLQAGQHYGVIVTNPPYVSQDSYADLPAEYRSEPALGLLSGRDGLDIPLRILAQAADFLAPDGVLVCEVGESAEALQACLPATPLVWIEFEHGGDGVFTIERESLVASQQEIRTVLENRKDVV